MNILGLDISTTTIGISLISFNPNGTFSVPIFEGLELKLSKKKYSVDDMSDLNKLFHKSDIFKERITQIKEQHKVDYISVEESLLNSNNIRTVGLLNRFNGMVTQITYDTFNIIPIFNSAHSLRSYALPSLVTVSKFRKDGSKRLEKEIEKDTKKNIKTLFGSFRQTDNKKVILFNEIYSLYKDKLPEPTLNRNGKVEEKWYDATDAFVCALGLYNMSKSNHQQ